MNWGLAAWVNEGLEMLLQHRIQLFDENLFLNLAVQGARHVHDELNPTSDCGVRV